MYIILAGSGFISSRISIWYLAKPGSSLVTKKSNLVHHYFKVGVVLFLYDEVYLLCR